MNRSVFFVRSIPSKTGITHLLVLLGVVGKNVDFLLAEIVAAGHCDGLDGVVDCGLCIVGLGETVASFGQCSRYRLAG